MWLQPDENTGDCKTSYSVVATVDVMRLQKKAVAKNKHVRDCNLIAVCFAEKTVAKKQHVTAIAKTNSCKKTGKV
jgi:hypothetical protein